MFGRSILNFLCGKKANIKLRNNKSYNDGNSLYLAEAQLKLNGSVSYDIFKNPKYQKLVTTLEMSGRGEKIELQIDSVDDPINQSGFSVKFLNSEPENERQSDIRIQDSSET